MKKWDILFIQEESSSLDSESKMFSLLYGNVEKAYNEQDALSSFETKKYDMIIGDITADANNILLLKKIKDKDPKQTIFALVSPQDADKLYKIAESDINAFELTPEQFDLALEEMAKFNPYEPN